VVMDPGFRRGDNQGKGQSFASIGTTVT
jgi:hypothetical protein